MPLPRVVCPECGAGLKSPTGFAPGQTVNCPKCETPFTVEEAAAAAPVAAKKPVRAVAALDEDDDDDDRPRKKRRRDDEDEDDDRPRKGKKKAGGYKNSPLRFVVLGVLLVALGVMVYLLVLKKKKESDANADPAPAANTDDGPNPFRPGSGPVTPPERARSTNDMKHVTLGMLNHLDQNGTFPAAAICDPSGKPLLSWRVAILPFLEQQSLYGQFKLNEPWDSDTNKKLIQYMPKTYRGSVGTADGRTGFKVFVGGGAAFSLTKGKKMTDILDGTSNTLMVVESGPPVTWTKPEDIPYDPGQPLPNLSTSGDLLLVGMCDSSAGWKNWKAIPEKTRRAVITAAGGERVGIDW